MKLLDIYKIQFEKSGNIYNLTGDDIGTLNDDDSLVIGRALKGKISPEDQNELHEYLLNIKKHGTTLIYKDGKPVNKPNS